LEEKKTEPLRKAERFQAVAARRVRAFLVQEKCTMGSLAAAIVEIESVDAAADGTVSAPWIENPYRLVSLWDMIDFAAADWCQQFEFLENAICTHSAMPDQRAEVPEAQKKSVIHFLRFIENTSNVHGDGDLRGRAWFLRRNLEINEPFCYETLVRELAGLRNQLKAALVKKSFVFIPDGLSDYFDSDRMFGEAISKRFPAAKEEIIDACNCIAAQLYTASVFHLMRISEHGLRALARKLRVTLQDRKKRQPLEYADWNKVITACKNKLTATRTMASGPRKQRRLEQFSEAADHCEYMKDIWRNDMAHARKRYGHHDALGVFDRVKVFMAFLVDRALAEK
jgi:hypothetical protein